MRKLGAAGSVLAVMSLSASLAVVTSSTAVASQTTRCEPTARIFTVQSDGDLWLYEHSKPATGEYAWSGARHIGTDWAGGRTLAGQFGYVYSITASGDVRRFRWAGEGWDRGGAYDVVGRDWGRYATAEHRNKITVDYWGDVYSIDPAGQLVRSTVVGNELKSQVVAQDWGRFDLITSSGPGTLYARASSNGDVFRFRYHRDSNRFYEGRTPILNRFNDYGKVFGAGGGVLFSTAKSNGDLVWNRDRAVHDDDIDFDLRRVVGNGWGGDVDTTAAPDACRRDPEFGPGTPANSIDAYARSSIVNSDGTLKIAYRQDDGTVRVLSEDTENTWNGRVVGQGQYVMDIAALPDGAGGINVHAEHRNGARTFTVRADGEVSASTELGGAAMQLPVVTQDGSAYFVDNGDLWYRKNAEPWRRKRGTNLGNWGLTALTRPDGVIVLVTTGRATTSAVMITDDHGRISDPQELGGPQGLDPGLSLDADGTVRVTYTDVVTEELVTRRVGGSGSQDWVAVPGLRAGYFGGAAAAVGADGRVDIVRRAAGGQTVVSTQLEPNGTAFGPWVPLGGTDASLPNIARGQSGQLVITFRDVQGVPQVYRRTASGYVGGKVG